MATNYFRIKRGLNLDNSQTTAVSIKGDLAYNTSTDKFEGYNGAADPFVNEAKAATLTNKTLSGSSNTFSNINYSSLSLSNSIVNTDINSSAAIAYSKLNLSGSIVNADIATGAAIAYSKLTLTGSIVNADINASAAVAYSKLNLSASIVSTDIASAGIDAAHGGTGNTSYTKGDILVASGSTTLTKLAVGSNGQGLIADSAQTTGVKWSPVLANPMTTLGDIIYEDVTPTPVRLAGNTTSAINFLGQTGTGSVSAAPAWTAFTAPTIQKFTSTGTRAGFVIRIVSTLSANLVAGAVYTNDGTSNSFTAANSVNSGSNVGPIFWTGSGTYSGGGMTKVSGTGPSTITYVTADASDTATYTTSTSPRTPVYIRVRGVGGGGGGGGGWHTGSPASSGGAGGNTYFGAALLSATGGAGGIGGATPSPSAGGTASLGTGPIGIALSGGSGGAGANNDGVTGVFLAPGGTGGNSAFGGGGGGGVYAGTSGPGAGLSGAANTGGGGGGGTGLDSSTGDSNGAGGGAGGFFDAIISSPATTYLYAVGTSGTAGAHGTAGDSDGGAGGSGLIEVTEFYQ